MNTISFLFAHKESDQWSTPLAIHNEFKNRGWKTKIYSLYDKDNNYSDTNIHSLLKTKPDIIMHMDWGQHQSYALADLRRTKAFLVFESGDDPQRFENNMMLASNFDLTLSPDAPSTMEYRKLGINAFWWNHFADTSIYKPLDTSPKYAAVCSRGMNRGAPIIDNIARKLPHDVVNQNGWEGKHHNEFLNSGYIVLQQSRYGEITRRIFEGMAAGRMVLTDRLNLSRGLNELFDEGEDIVYYGSEAECVNKIGYYCSNHKERERIAKNGYDKVLRNHTVANRVDFIIGMWQRYKSPK